MSIRETVERVFTSVYLEQNAGPVELNDDLVLLKSGMDSIGFAILVTTLEDELGFDPFSTSDEPYYPQTFGDFVNYYEKNSP